MMKFSKDRIVQTSIAIVIVTMMMTITNGHRLQIRQQQKVDIDHAVEHIIVVHQLQLLAAAAATPPLPPQHQQPHADRILHLPFKIIQHLHLSQQPHHHSSSPIRQRFERIL